jgi:hypothetical protein
MDRLDIASLASAWLSLGFVGALLLQVLA